MDRRWSVLSFVVALVIGGVTLDACAGSGTGVVPGSASVLSTSGTRPFASPKVIAEYPTLTAAAGPSKLALGSDKNIWFSETNADLIGRITPAGVVTEFVVPKVGCPTRLALGSDGNVWFTIPCSTGFIGRITPRGSVTTFAIPTVHGGPNGLTAGPDQRLWFTEQNVDKIGAVTTAGSFKEYPITSGAYPLDITPGPDGNLWFSEFLGNRIGRMTTSGAFTEFALPSPNAYPSGITTGPDGNLWFAEQGISQIGKITPSGQITEYPLAACGGPYQITPASDGNLYIVCAGSGPIVTGANQIARMTTGGVSAIYPIPSANSQPLGIAVGSDGNLWFTEFNTSRIGIFRFK